MIKSEDRLFSISYMLGQKDTARPFSPVNPYIIVKGKEFKGVPGLGRQWERFLAPCWEDQAVTPGLVAAIIDWCFTVEEVTCVNCRGEYSPAFESGEMKDQKQD